MKTFKTRLSEAGTADGFLGDISDAEGIRAYTGRGITDPTKQGSFGTVHQNRADFKPSKNIQSQELDQIHSMIYTYLSGVHEDPRQALYGLKVRLNHLGLDFEFNRNVPLPVGPVTLKLTRYGEKFGTTPTTNLMQDGFDRGQDYTNISLQMNLMQDQSKRFYFDGINLVPDSTMRVTVMTPVNQKMTAESVFNFMASDEDFSENVLKPIALNLYEKMENNQITEEEFDKKVNFVVERASKRLGVEFSQEDKTILAEGLAKQILEAESLTGQEGQSDISRIDKMAKASGKGGKSVKERRAERLAQLRKEVKKLKGNKGKKK
jgi:hypothetical protein